MSAEQAEAFGRRIGRLIWRLSKKHRARSLWNLAHAFPELSDDERKALAIRSLEHFGIVTTDFFRMCHMTNDQICQSMTVEGQSNLDQALEAGKGVVLITGHFGNWERLSAWITIAGHKLSVVARDVSDSALNQMVNELRSRTGTEVIARGNAARPIIERLRQNQLVGILPDQNADEAYLPLFGMPAGTVLGPGVIAERTGSPVVCCWCVRTGVGQYRMIIEPALQPTVSGTQKGEAMMIAIHGALENIIRQYPEQWLWIHDRWKNARKKGLISGPGPESLL